MLSKTSEEAVVKKL